MTVTAAKTSVLGRRQLGACGSIGSNIQSSYEPRIRVQSCGDRDVGRACWGKLGLSEPLTFEKLDMPSDSVASLHSWPVHTNLNRWRLDVMCPWRPFACTGAHCFSFGATAWRVAEPMAKSPRE